MIRSLHLSLGDFGKSVTSRNSKTSQPIHLRKVHQGLRCAVKGSDEVTAFDSVCQIIVCIFILGVKNGNKIKSSPQPK